METVAKITLMRHEMLFELWHIGKEHSTMETFERLFEKVFIFVLVNLS